MGSLKDSPMPGVHRMMTTECPWGAFSLGRGLGITGVPGVGGDTEPGQVTTGLGIKPQVGDESGWKEGGGRDQLRRPKSLGERRVEGELGRQEKPAHRSYRSRTGRAIYSPR